MVLKLFAETGYVPQVYDIRSDSILVMQRFIGLPFYPEKFIKKVVSLFKLLYYIRLHA